MPATTLLVWHRTRTHKATFFCFVSPLRTLSSWLCIRKALLLLHVSIAALEHRFARFADIPYQNGREYEDLLRLTSDVETHYD